MLFIGLKIVTDDKYRKRVFKKQEKVKKIIDNQHQAVQGTWHAHDPKVPF